VGYYRLHYLDGFRADTVRVREFEAESDEAAIAYGIDVRSLSPMELWQGDRRVRHWDAFPPTTTQTSFGNSPPRGRRAAPRTQAPLIVELSIGPQKHPATLSEISRTGAKLNGISHLAEGQELEFSAGNLQALAAVVWSEGTECAIAFDIPIAAAEVVRLRALADFVAAVSGK
jgi:hypothetical protein